MPELLVIGGGGNDLIKCGSDKNCMQRTLNKILSSDFQRGYLIDAIAQNSDFNTKIIVLYPSGLPLITNAWKTVVRKIGQKYASGWPVMQKTQGFWLDATLVAKTSVPSHWSKDGYHPSVVANMRLAKTIKKIYKGDIEHTISDYVTPNMIPSFPVRLAFTNLVVMINKIHMNICKLRVNWILITI